MSKRVQFCCTIIYHFFMHNYCFLCLKKFLLLLKIYFPHSLLFVCFLFFFRSFIVLVFIFRTVIHFKINCVNDVRLMPRLFFSKWKSMCSSTICGIDIPCLVRLHWDLCEIFGSSYHFSMIYFSAL